MPTKSKEQPTADKKSTAKKTPAKSTAQKTTRRKTAQKSTARTTAKKKADAEKTPLEQTFEPTLSQQTLLEMTPAPTPESVAAVLSTEEIPHAPLEKTIAEDKDVTQAGAMDKSKISTPGSATPPNQSTLRPNLVPQTSGDRLSAPGLTVGNGVNFLANELIADNMWTTNAAIPTLDEATYAAQKAQAEAQRRAIEVASLNLQNINDLHELERQSIDVAISAKANETRTAQLAGAGLDYQTQLEINGEKSQHLAQAAAKHQAATRETGYAEQLIEIKDQNFELEIQQAQNIFAEKAARYRAQLTGQ